MFWQIKQILSPPFTKKMPSAFGRFFFFTQIYPRHLWHFVTQLWLLHTNWIALNWTESTWTRLHWIKLHQSKWMHSITTASFLRPAAALDTIGCPVYASLHSHANSQSPIIIAPYQCNCNSCLRHSFSWVSICVVIPTSWNIRSSSQSKQCSFVKYFVQKVFQIATDFRGPAWFQS